MFTVTNLQEESENSTIFLKVFVFKSLRSSRVAKRQHYLNRQFSIAYSAQNSLFNDIFFKQNSE
ncbi:hypothetical protein BpHYR1_049186 [Brachionus plicatilis]|uniref:Uncharacterized protein n=1 Tax=Brachionus plicatilis TaxID=10195 RepID=A0A3M7S8A4_BRAPC|nr:hypothetical protein BpHYR1_049186 [Brachionus plicatilis]